MCVSGVAPLILLKWSMFQTKLLEKTYLHVMPNAVFFLLALHMKLLNSQHRFSTCICEDCWSFLFFMIIKWDFLSTDIKILVYISECILFQLNLARLLKYLGVCGGAVGWGTALQAGSSWVRFPMLSWEFFIDTILPVILWPWGWLSL